MAASPSSLHRNVKTKEVREVKGETKGELVANTTTISPTLQGAVREYFTCMESLTSAYSLLSHIGLMHESFEYDEASPDVRLTDFAAAVENMFKLVCTHFDTDLETAADNARGTIHTNKLITTLMNGSLFVMAANNQIYRLNKSLFGDVIKEPAMAVLSEDDCAVAELLSSVTLVLSECNSQLHCLNSMIKTHLMAEA